MTEVVKILSKPRIMRRMRAMELGMENMLYMITGEPERSCKLYFYIPGCNEFKGKLYPTNPVVERQRTDTPALIQEAL